MLFWAFFSLPPVDGASRLVLLGDYIWDFLGSCLAFTVCSVELPVAPRGSSQPRAGLPSLFARFDSHAFRFPLRFFLSKKARGGNKSSGLFFVVVPEVLSSDFPPRKLGLWVLVFLRG